jgi:hypothetical protein
MELRLDVRRVYLCYDMPLYSTPAALLSDEYLNKSSRVITEKVNIEFRIFFLVV